MVRLKNRYLLVNMLYPALDNRPVDPEVPDVVVFNQPTIENLNHSALLKGIKAEVSSLFGDYGAGAIGESIQIKYLSLATSTFILRVTRAHYRIVWAALSFMNSIPVKNGRSCVFRVVRVSGTIRKAEEEAVRRARDVILKAQREMETQGDSTLESIFGKFDDHAEPTKESLMVDRDDSDEDEEMSDDD